MFVHVYYERSLKFRRLQVTNLANASSLVFNALQAFPDFGTGDRMVNWCGPSMASSLPFAIHSDMPLMFRSLLHAYQLQDSTCTRICTPHLGSAPEP